MKEYSFSCDSVSFRTRITNHKPYRWRTVISLPDKDTRVNTQLRGRFRRTKGNVVIDYDNCINADDNSNIIHYQPDGTFVSLQDVIDDALTIASEVQGELHDNCKHIEEQIPSKNDAKILYQIVYLDGVLNT